MSAPAPDGLLARARACKEVGLGRTQALTDCNRAVALGELPGDNVATLAAVEAVYGPAPAGVEPSVAGDAADAPDDRAVAPTGEHDSTDGRDAAPPGGRGRARGRSPMFTSLYEVTGENTPPLDPPVIDGLLRERQKALVSAPSKAGKTWLCIGLMWALADGRDWLGMRCRPSRVAYVNAEVSAASFANRCEAVRRELGVDHEAARRVSVLSGRGTMLDAGTLADAAVAELAGGVDLMIVDCLYQLVPAGADENKARDVGPLMRQLDRIVEGCGCSLVVVHHQPKGASGHKASIDRSAGSGVLARSPDALVSLDPLAVPEGGDLEAELRDEGARAMRLSFDLRDFPPRPPLDVIFTGRRFLHDASGRLAGLPVAGSAAAGGTTAARRRADERRQKADLIRECIAACKRDGEDAMRAAVLNRYNAEAAAHGLSSVEMATLRKWTADPGGALPFRVDGRGELYELVGVTV